MQLSIVILNYNVRYFLELCLLSVEAAVRNLDAEIIVVDNNSADDSCTMVQSRFPGVKLIRHPSNSGFPKGNNIGVAAAKGDYICILNPDTVVAEDTFEKLLLFAATAKNHGITGVKLIDGTGRFLPESKRGIPTPWVAFTRISGLYRLSSYFGRYYAAHLNKNQTGNIEVLVGAFMFLKRDLYLELGGFDEDYFMYGEDMDLCYRVLKTGRSNYYYAGTTVIHFKGESTTRDSRYLKRFNAGTELFYKKHFRQSWFFTSVTTVGMALFTLVRILGFTHVRPLRPEKYLLFSQNPALLERLEAVLKKPVALYEVQHPAAIWPKTIAGSSCTQLLLDNNFIDFKTIINALETLKSRYVTFRILPQSSVFMIGSDSSIDRGEVRIFDHQQH